MWDSVCSKRWVNVLWTNFNNLSHNIDHCCHALQCFYSCFLLWRKLKLLACFIVCRLILGIFGMYFTQWCLCWWCYISIKQGEGVTGILMMILRWVEKPCILENQVLLKPVLEGHMQSCKLHCCHMKSLSETETLIFFLRATFIKFQLCFAHNALYIKLPELRQDVFYYLWI